MELEKVMDLSHEDLLEFVSARTRRRLQRGLKRKHLALVNRIKKAKAGISFFSLFL